MDNNFVAFVIGFLTGAGFVTVVVGLIYGFKLGWRIAGEWLKENQIK